MLKMPEGADPTITILAIDPGSTFAGIAILKYHPDEKRIISATTELLNMPKMCKELIGVDPRDYALLRLDAFGKALSKILEDHQPDEVVAESAFFSMPSAGSFSVLVQVMDRIQIAVNQYRPYTTVYKIPPSNVKNAVGAKGDAKKDPIKNALLKLNDLNYTGEVPMQLLSEHEIDALAVGYTKIMINIGVIKNVTKYAR